MSRSCSCWLAAGLLLPQFCDLQRSRRCSGMRTVAQRLSRLLLRCASRALHRVEVGMAEESCWGNMRSCCCPYVSSPQHVRRPPSLRRLEEEKRKLKEKDKPGKVGAVSRINRSNLTVSSVGTGRA